MPWARLRAVFPFIRVLIWFPYKTPSLSSFKGSLSDFEHLGLRGSEHGHFLDSVPVGAPQIAGTSENVLLWLQKQVYHRHSESTRRQADSQEKKCARRCKMRTIRPVSSRFPCNFTNLPSGYGLLVCSGACAAFGLRTISFQLQQTPTLLWMESRPTQGRLFRSA